MFRSGAVYLFRYQNSYWEQQAYIKASNTDASDRFGHAVSLSDDGDTLAVGAVYEDSAATGINGDEANNTRNGSGAVYLFRYQNTSWEQQAYIKPSNTHENQYFGSAISLGGTKNTLAVGAYGDNGHGIFSGAVHLY